MVDCNIKSKGKKQQKNKKTKIINNDISIDSDNDIKETADIELSRSEINSLICKAKSTESVTEIIELSKSKSPDVRLKAIQRLCPCRVLDDIKIFWDRIFEMTYDEDPKVRYQVLHNMCDGSPPEYENKVLESLEVFNKDSDKDVRRRAHKVMGSYLKTGKYNIL
jgi:hypothetical protein